VSPLLIHLTMMPSTEVSRFQTLFADTRWATAATKPPRADAAAVPPSCHRVLTAASDWPLATADIAVHLFTHFSESRQREVRRTRLLRTRMNGENLQPACGGKAAWSPTPSLGLAPMNGFETTLQRWHGYSWSPRDCLALMSSQIESAGYSFVSTTSIYPFRRRSPDCALGRQVRGKPPRTAD
jgi:hypothetical protein